MNRKDDHVRLALAQPFQKNDFDRVRLEPHVLSLVHVDKISLKSSFLNQTIPYPFYINAMTGGSLATQTINERLAQLASHFGIPMATGSVSAALKDPTLEKTFTVIRSVNPQGFVLANIGGGQKVENAIKAVKLLNANALQIHLNVIQELLMPEGDKDFSSWAHHVKVILKELDVPVLVKEVGFGMGLRSLQALKQLGVQYVDVAGQGGTNFAVIENGRRTEALPLFNEMGLSTVESLLAAKLVDGLTIYASGGVRQGLDIVKALVLGAQAVGLSGYFLKLVTTCDHPQAVMQVEKLIQEIKYAMALVGASSIEALKQVPFLLDNHLMTYQTQLYERKN